MLNLFFFCHVSKLTPHSRYGKSDKYAEWLKMQIPWSFPQRVWFIIRKLAPEVILMQVTGSQSSCGTKKADDLG